MGKELGKPALRTPPYGDTKNVHSGGDTPTGKANQDEGRPGRQRYGSETLSVKAKAFNHHRAKDTPNTSDWTSGLGSTGER
jgi:hypothetical protein